MSTDLHSPLDTATAIRTRRSVPFGRLSAEQPEIPEALVWTLLEAAHWAPSHGNTQPWRFGVFTGAGRARLAEVLATSMAAHKGLTDANAEAVAELHAAQQATQAQAPVWIVVAAKTPAITKFPPQEEDWATAAAIQNLLLAARAHGLGSKWMTNAAVMHPATLPALGFEEGCRPIGLVYLAQVDEWPEGRRDPVAGQVMWVRE
ncbi:nitroreductase [Deinococcus sp. Marseille-Q6407]|uniref:nitroreductase family protein n=1 Tax=Deinococcus sp. Marseille-Q6407 TaxID=2969223 RepID=UPI0021BE58B5|nr:nitroreductase [Deinococcus sp. Marseille-Q6407]